jgi:hypothetical protein
MTLGGVYNNMKEDRQRTAALSSVLRPEEDIGFVI